VSAPTLQTDAFILLKRPPTDAFQSFTAFTEEHGSLLILQRVPGRRAATAGSPAQRAASTVALDLFDEVSLILESSNQGRTWFVREARLITRPTGIGRSYETLRHASALADLIARNAVPEESRAAVAGLLRAALAAFASGVRPDVTAFKGLYLFARDEGYPLRQQWFPTLPAPERDLVAGLLNRPLSGQTAAAADVARLRQRLEDYLRHHTEILLD